MRLLVTRPEPDGERTAQALRARGHAVVLAPLLRTEPVAFALPDERFSAVVLTSANAARAIADHPRRAQLTAMPAFTVGRRTAEAARAVGFRAVHSADGDKGDLVALLRADLLRTQSDTHGAPLLYLAGEDRAGDLAQGDLAQAGLPVRTVVVYRAVKAARFPPDVAAAWRRARSTACCIFPPAARRPISIAPRTAASATRRSRRCIIVSPARWRRRSPPPAPPRCGSRPGPTRPRCWSWSGAVGHGELGSRRPGRRAASARLEGWADPT